MACPWFIPQVLAQAEGRLPLGDAYWGQCAARAEPFIPPESRQKELCCCGYARGRCDRFPEPGPDAHRFSVVEDQGEMIRVVWVEEEDQAPAAHGVFEFFESRCLAGTTPLEIQAQAFASGYFRRRSRAL